MRYLSLQIILSSSVDAQQILFCHAIRRVNCVIGRTERNEVAYVAREPSGQLYRRLCHLFKTKSSSQVQEIESVLENAFHAAALNKPAMAADSKIHLKLIPSNLTTPGGASVNSNLNSKRTQVQQHCHQGTQNFTTPAVMTNTTDVPSNIPSNSDPCKLHSTSILFNRLFGKHRVEIDHNNKENKTAAASTNMAITSNTPNKRQRRPVSAVFSQALHRLSSASIYNKRFSSTDTPRKLERPVSICQALPSCTALPSQDSTSATHLPFITREHIAFQEEDILRPFRHTQTTPSLRYDKRLTEWIYPIDENLEKQLRQVAYFCRFAHRNNVISALLEQSEGAFVIRLSESKRKCLALSVRVPFSHNPTGVSHYLIIRNNNGFKLRGSNKYFPSIPMLVTHHSVMPEQLPCRLIFAHWGNRWKCTETNNNYDYPPNDNDDKCSKVGNDNHWDHDASATDNNNDKGRDGPISPIFLQQINFE